MVVVQGTPSMHVTDRIYIYCRQKPIRDPHTNQRKTDKTLYERSPDMADIPITPQNKRRKLKAPSNSLVI
jgi:hypothetical protein